jgi:hypothetical protein
MRKVLAWIQAVVANYIRFSETGEPGGPPYGPRFAPGPHVPR